jgi:hypothetical protein
MQDPESGSFDAIANLKDTIKLYESRWEDHLKNIPIATYPQIAAIVQETYMMPGGRSRYFRAIWGKNF